MLFVTPEISAGTKSGWWEAPTKVRRPAVLLACFTILYFTSSIQAARKAPLDVDEVFVMWIVRYFPGWRVMTALKMGLDSLPPTYYWLAQGFSAVLGQTPLAIRMPAILGYFLFPLSVFFLLRRRVSWQVAFAAMFFTCVTAADWARTTARPYGIVVGGFAVAAAAWADLPNSRNRRRRCLLIYAGLSLALLVHFLAVYVVAALAVAELLRSRHERRIHWDCWIALAASFATLLLWFPLILPIYHSTHVSVQTPGFYAKPTIPKLLRFSADMLLGTFPELMTLLFVALLIPLELAKRESSTGLGGPPWQKRENAQSYRSLDILTFAAFTLPAVAFVSSQFVGSFNERYFIAATLGVVLLLARGLDSLYGGTRLAWLVVAICTLQLLASGSGGVDPRVALVEAAPQNLPVVVSSGSDFFYLSNALPDSEAKRLSFVSPPPGFASPDTEPEIIATRWKRAEAAMPVFRWQDWTRMHSTFYVLYSSDPREGMTDWLLTHESAEIVRHSGKCWLLKVTLAR